MKFKRMTRVCKHYYFMNMGNDIGKETQKNVGTGFLKF